MRFMVHDSPDLIAITPVVIHDSPDLAVVVAPVFVHNASDIVIAMFSIADSFAIVASISISAKHDIKPPFDIYIILKRG